MTAYSQARFTIAEQEASNREIMRAFCIDTVRNLRQIVDDMNDVRSKSRAIHGDYLALMDVEIGVFGRNREHLVRLSEPMREPVRRFVTDCSIRRAEIGNFLAEFQNKWRLADELQAAGQGPQAERARIEAGGPLTQANQALDQLVLRAKDSVAVIAELQKRSKR